jgi:hypothetical protein
LPGHHQPGGGSGSAPSGQPPGRHTDLVSVKLERPNPLNQLQLPTPPPVVSTPVQHFGQHDKGVRVQHAILQSHHKMILSGL